MKSDHPVATASRKYQDHEREKEQQIDPPFTKLKLPFIGYTGLLI
jgi:hypothetical protein